MWNKQHKPTFYNYRRYISIWTSFRFITAEDKDKTKKCSQRLDPKAVALVIWTQNEELSLCCQAVADQCLYNLFLKLSRCFSLALGILREGCFFFFFFLLIKGRNPCTTVVTYTLTFREVRKCKQEHLWQPVELANCRKSRTFWWLILLLHFNSF